jgi:hypothetical protein
MHKGEGRELRGREEKCKKGGEENIMRREERPEGGRKRVMEGEREGGRKI